MHFFLLMNSKLVLNLCKYSHKLLLNISLSITEVLTQVLFKKLSHGRTEQKGYFEKFHKIRKRTCATNLKSLHKKLATEAATRGVL